MNVSGSVLNLLEQSAEKWRLCETLPEHDLLRLAVLRELLQGLHAEKSRFLAKGKQGEATSIRQIESAIEDLRNSKPLEGDLKPLLTGEAKLKKRSRLLPAAVFQFIEREKLERFDRQWEAAIAAEALSQGWRIWNLQAWVEIPKVEEWNLRLVEQLWPHGLVLFVESAGAHHETYWLGQWTCVLHPKFRAPDEALHALADWQNWPGTPARVPSAPNTPFFRVLFSPKTS